MYVAIALSSWVVNDLFAVAGAAAEEEEEEEDGKSSGATARKAARTTRSAFSLNFFDESARTTRNDFECMMNADTRLVCICFDSISNHSASECKEREREKRFFVLWREASLSLVSSLSTCETKKIIKN